MNYSRINLNQVKYIQLDDNWNIITSIDIEQLNDIYLKYCRYKDFESVMPIFDSEYTDRQNDIFGYYVNSSLVAFSLIRRHDNVNVETIQFAWNYEYPDLRLGVISLKHECAYYRDHGFKFLYLGGSEEYKQHIDGFEMLGPA